MRFQLILSRGVKRGVIFLPFAALWGWVIMLVEGSLADHHLVFRHPWGYGICFVIGLFLSIFFAP